MRETVEQLTREYEKNRPYYMTVASNIVGSQRGEDVVQQAFLLAFSCLRQYNGTASLRTWMHAITRNAALDFIRRTKRHDNCLVIDEEVASSITSAQCNAEKGLENSEFTGRLYSAIHSKRLNGKERAAILYFLDTGHGVNSPTWKTQKFRAIQKLRKAMIQ